MDTLLKKYFPIIRTREEVLDLIGEKEKLTDLFESWSEEQQEEFLDFCTGAKGVKMLYDSFFKEIFNPEYHAERLEELLSLLLETKIRIKQILPNDSVRLADEYTLLITDIVIETEDGRIANLEIQKIGYAFPGQRTACYSADLLLRQYKRVKDRKRRENKKFNYRDLKKVYTIVLFEKSTREFHEIPDKYLHYGEHTYDTGLRLETLQKSVLVALDIFQKNIENRSIENKLEAWLLLLSSDEPERIMELLEKYPEFREIYEEVYQMCRNVEGIMSLFSKELEEMDRNTVSYMIEELEAEVKAAEERAEQERKEREAAEERAEQERQERETAEERAKQEKQEREAAEERAKQEKQEREAAEERAKQQIAELQEKIRRLESAKKEE